MKGLSKATHTLERGDKLTQRPTRINGQYLKCSKWSIEVMSLRLPSTHNNSSHTLTLLMEPFVSETLSIGPNFSDPHCSSALIWSSIKHLSAVEIYLYIHMQANERVTKKLSHKRHSWEKQNHCRWWEDIHRTRSTLIQTWQWSAAYISNILSHLFP